jgi:Protein of unknown function (DUF2924)
MAQRTASTALPNSTSTRPGTVLVGEWDRRLQRVMVLADGFAWSGQTYDSLSKVAFAITGTKQSFLQSTRSAVLLSEARLPVGIRINQTAPAAAVER